MQIDGLHLTSWRPCWRYNTKEYFISSIVGSSRRGWLVLCATSREMDCKLRIKTLTAWLHAEFNGELDDWLNFILKDKITTLTDYGLPRV